VITEVEGVEVGHWTDGGGRTGCTVVLLPEGVTASGEVRGGAPATREIGVLDPTRLVDGIDAVVLAGGSAFGLAAADGVVRWLAEQGRGFATGARPVPIVVGLALFDLFVGSADVAPGPDEGRLAAEDAGVDPQMGAVGAGTGASWGGWRGPGASRASGIGSVSMRRGELVVGALIAANPFGDVRSAEVPDDLPDLPVDDDAFAQASRSNTTIGMVATNAALTKTQCFLVAQSAHDGLARALEPAHSLVDGDALVAVATGAVPAALDHVRVLAARTVEAATMAAAGVEPRR
jgi:L-aminopeptidase/D-esterase-like protein